MKNGVILKVYRKYLRWANSPAEKTPWFEAFIFFIIGVILVIKFKGQIEEKFFSQPIRIQHPNFDYVEPAYPLPIHKHLREINRK